MIKTHTTPEPLGLDGGGGVPAPVLDLDKRNQDGSEEQDYKSKSELDPGETADTSTEPSASTDSSHNAVVGRDGTDLEAQAAGPEGKRKKLELQDQTNLLPPKQVFIVFCGLGLALFCSSLNQTIIVTALPTLGRVLGRADIVSWVGTSYLLTSTVMQPLYGRLSDIFGRKPTLLACCLIFFVGSLACSVSASMIQLICFRALQGIGGGGIMTLSMIIVSDIVTLKERGKYQGIIGMVIATSNSIGPLIGGLLTEKATWRWLFWISLCITPIAFLVVLFLLPLKAVRGDTMTKLRAVDWLGSILTLMWATLILIGLSWAGTQYAWSSAAVLVPIILGLALLVLFLFVETHVSLPVIPLYIFRSSTVCASMASTFFSGVAFFSLLYYLPTYLQVVHEVSPIRSGILTLPLATTQTVMAFIAGFIASKTGDYWWNMVIGFAMWTIGLGLMSTISVSTSEATFIGFELVTAVGAGQTFQISLLAIQAAVQRKEMAAATGMRNFMRLLGGTVGLAACSAVVNNIVGNRLRGAGLAEDMVELVMKDPTPGGGWIGLVDSQIVRESYAQGIRGIFYLLIPLIAISCLIVIFFIEKISLKRDDDEAKKEEGKQWVERRKNKRGRRGGAAVVQGEASPQGAAKVETDSLPTDHHLGGRLKEEMKRDEKALKETAKIFDQAAGVMPARPNEGVDKTDIPGRL